MARVQLLLDDSANRLTLKAMLEAAGHRVVAEGPDVVVTDDLRRSVALAQTLPALVLAGGAQIREAVSAMRQGVYGYIFVPFQPGEAAIMVERAAKEYPFKSQIAEGPLTLEQAEAHHILATLGQCKNNRANAARLLGIGRNTLWRKLKRIAARER